MPPYLDALHAMHDLLGALGEEYWRAWVGQDIVEWEEQKSVRHHLSAYGGMGSFTDLSFQDVWLGTLFGYLQSACYHFAHHPTAKSGTQGLDHSMRGEDFELSGWRCLQCGYGVVSRRKIDSYLAGRLLRKLVVTESKKARLRELVAAVVHTRPSDPMLTPAKLSDWVSRSGLHLRDNDDWMHDCPSCGSDGTAVYRWLLTEKDDHRFVPAENNLPLRADPKV